MAITYVRTLGLAKYVMLVEGNCVLAPQNCDMLIWVLGTNTQIVHVHRICYCSSHKYQSVFYALFSTDIRRNVVIYSRHVMLLECWDLWDCNMLSSMYDGEERNQFECGYLEHREGDGVKICR